MIKFKINGNFQRNEAENVAGPVDHVNVRATFVEMADESAEAFEQSLMDEIAYARGDRGRLNALHSIRRHFLAATGRES